MQVLTYGIFVVPLKLSRSSFVLYLSGHVSFQFRLLLSDPLVELLNLQV
jgi:hypothetical protein